MRGTRRLVLLLFFLSGACGLVYQVVWTRLLTHVFGTTAIAVGTVLAAFMGGLAAGSFFLGRLADKSRDPLRLYAILEVGVGVAALLAHELLHRIAPAYLFAYEAFGRSDAALGVARFLLGFGLVLAPTLLMGATLPVLARYVVTRLSAVGAGLSTLYTINTVGAVAGTLVTGFHLIGAYGIDRTVHIAVLGNLAIGAVAWIASARGAVRPVEGGEPGEGPVTGARGGQSGGKADGKAGGDSGSGTGGTVGPAAYRLLLLGLAISGFTSFAYEIYWTRSLVVLLGNSTYAVTTMLTAFLAGIALGGWGVRFVVDRVADRAALFGWVQVLVGVTALAALPVLFAVVDPETLRVHVGEAADQTGRLLALRFGVALLVMLVPATLIGTTFPLIGRIGVVDLRRTGTVVGRIYAVNTVGNVLGALLPGLVLLSWFGIQRGILGMAVLNALVGVAVLASRLNRSPRLRWALPAALAVAVLAVTRAPLGHRFRSESETDRHRVLYYREGPSATTKVLLDPETGEKSMSVDAIDIGGTGFTEFKQLLLAHLPKLLCEDVSAELSIGLGSGMLAGESARHGRVRSITCVEIEPSVVEGAALFAEENHGVLADPRLHLVVDDVANHLRTTTERYQVVSADEKTAQDYASNGFSYSREYYELLRGRLAPGGIVAQWVPTTLPPRQYAMVLKTFSATFPHVLLWYFLPAYQEGAANTLLVGSNEQVELDLARMRRRMAAEPAAFESLAPYGLTTAEAVLAQLVARDESVRGAVRGARENTLVHPRYEFFPTSDYAVSREVRHRINHELLVGLKRVDAAQLAAALEPGSEERETLEAAFAAEMEFLAAFRGVLIGGNATDVFRRYEAAFASVPWNDSLRARLFLAYAELGSAQLVAGDLQTASLVLQRALALYGESAATHVAFATVLGRLGQLERAVEEGRIAVDLDPDLVAARRALAEALIRAGREPEAAEELRALLAIEPDDPAARAALSRL